MALDTLVVFGAASDTRDAAVADYDAVHDCYVPPRCMGRPGNRAGGV